MSNWKLTPTTYAIYNTKTKRTYIGSSKNVTSRWWGHIENALVKGDTYNDLYEDMRTQHLSSFTFRVLAQHSDMDEAEDAELRAIAALINSEKGCYNKRSISNVSRFPTDVPNPYVQPKTKKAPKPPTFLTPRQQVLVVALVKEGLKQREVARLFKVAQSTVSKLLKRRGLR